MTGVRPTRQGACHRRGAPRAPSRRRGAAAFEHAALLAALALAGAVGLSALGFGFTEAIGGQAVSRSASWFAQAPASPSLAAQAGLASAADGARALARHAEQAEFVRRASNAGAAPDAAALARAEFMARLSGDAVPWLGDARRPINPTSDMVNCATCAFALDATLGGRPATALPTRFAEFAYDPKGFFRALLRDPARLTAALDRARDRALAIAARHPNLSAFTASVLEELDAVRRKPARIRRASDEARATLAAADAVPLGELEALGRALGFSPRRWQHLPSLRDVERVVGTWPDRAKGVVGVEDPNGVGHVFSALRHRGETYLLDAQTGLGRGSGAFEGYTASVLRTEDVPAWVDVDAFDLPPPSRRIGQAEAP